MFLEALWGVQNYEVHDVSLNLLWEARAHTNCPKLCGDCLFPQNFLNRKLGEITVFYAAFMFEKSILNTCLRYPFVTVTRKKDLSSYIFPYVE